MQVKVCDLFGNKFYAYDYIFVLSALRWTERHKYRMVLRTDTLGTRVRLAGDSAGVRRGRLAERRRSGHGSRQQGQN